MAKCPSCGAPIDANLKTCPYCGAKIELPMSTQEQTHQESKKRDSVEDELDDMNRKDLKEYIDDHDLDILVMKSWSDDDIREAIRTELTRLKKYADTDDDAKIGCLSKLGCLWDWLIGIVVFIVIVAIGFAIFA